MTSMLTVWMLFAACAATITAGGVTLSRHGPAIGRHAGLSGSWIGLALVAKVTSLPERVTGIGAVVIAGKANVAIGDIFGSCVYSLAILDDLQ